MTTLTDRPDIAPEVDEQSIPAPELALGDVITRDIAGTPVHWTLTSDPATCNCGNGRVMARTPDGVRLELFFRRRDTVTVQAPNARQAVTA